MHRYLAWAGFLLLIFFHLDVFWREQSPTLYLGWIPEEMAYRLVWMVAAWLYLIYFTRYVWTEEDV